MTDRIAPFSLIQRNSMHEVQRVIPCVFIPLKDIAGKNKAVDRRGG